MSLDYEQIEGVVEYADSHSPFYVEDVKESQSYDFPAPFAIYMATNMLNESYESMLHHDDFDIEPCIDIDDSWKEKLANMWSPSDVSSWIKSLVNKYPPGFIQEQPYWDIDGTSLICKSQKAFKSLDPISGDYVYEELQKLCAEQLKRMSGCVEATCEQKYQEQMDSITAILNIYSFDGTEFKSFDKYLDGKLEKESSSDDESDVSDPPSPTPSPVPKAKKPERKRKGKLWEFIRDLLLDDGKNPSIIKWEDRSQGVFKIVRSDKVAELWGSRKANTSMTYEKMSRAMRYYYRKGILEKIDDGRRLVYKFGSKSKGWQI